MSRRHWIVTLSSCALVGLTLLACSSSEDLQDGDACEEAEECLSKRCVAGACEGSDCKCEGAACRGRSTCREGWLCTRADANVEVLPLCRQQCTGPGTCPADKRCENGICRTGAEPFALEWLNIPRVVPCGARVPCEYKVRPSTGVTVDTYTWTFGKAPPIDTKEPTTSFTYEARGTYSVLVTARSSNGATAELRTTEILCFGGVGSQCDPGGDPCCEGSCGASLLCR